MSFGRRLHSQRRSLCSSAHWLSLPSAVPLDSVCSVSSAVEQPGRTCAGRARSEDDTGWPYPPKEEVPVSHSSMTQGLLIAENAG
jgi:hypothetical protein